MKIKALLIFMIGLLGLLGLGVYFSFFAISVKRYMNLGTCERKEIKWYFSIIKKEVILNDAYHAISDYIREHKLALSDKWDLRSECYLNSFTGEEHSGKGYAQTLDFGRVAFWFEQKISFLKSENKDIDAELIPIIREYLRCIHDGDRDAQVKMSNFILFDVTGMTETIWHKKEIK